MYCRVTDLRYKDVVNMRDGMRLGCVCDVEVDTATAQMCIRDRWWTRWGTLPGTPTGWMN